MNCYYIWERRLILLRGISYQDILKQEGDRWGRRTNVIKVADDEGGLDRAHLHQPEVNPALKKSWYRVWLYWGVCVIKVSSNKKAIEEQDGPSWSSWWLMKVGSIKPTFITHQVWWRWWHCHHLHQQKVGSIKLTSSVELILEADLLQQNSF